MTQNKVTKLIAEAGRLYIPLEAITDPLQRSYHTEKVMLMVVYNAGDCDSISWPDPNRENLSRALYDAQEMGLLPPHGHVLLPDGEIVLPEQRARVTAAEIPCYAIYQDDYSDEWGNKLIKLWIEKKRTCNSMTHEQFLGELQNAIIGVSDWPEAFRQACAEVGADQDNDFLYLEYVELHRGEVFNLIPSNLHAEFCWVPEWDGLDLDSLMDELGLRADPYNSSAIEDVVPGKWLETFLHLVNQSSEAVIAAAVAIRDGQPFADKCAESGFKVDLDPSRPSLMTPEEVVATIENAYHWAVPMFHCQINVKALFQHDHTKPMRLSSEAGKVHLGLHDGVLNGAGYMDTYPGEVVIPAEATGFAGESRWQWSVNKVYGIYKPVFKATPEAA